MMSAELLVVKIKKGEEGHKTHEIKLTTNDNDSSILSDLQGQLTLEDLKLKEVNENDEKMNETEVLVVYEDEELGTTKSDLEEILLKLRSLDEEIVEELGKLLEDVQKHHLHCNVAKTAGTSLGTAGLIMTLTGLFLAVPTAGVSLGLSFAGMGTSIAGGLTNSGTGITKQILLKKIQARMEKSLEKRVETYEEYRAKMAYLNEMMEELKSIGIPAEEAKKRILNALGDGGTVLSASMNVKKLVEGALVANTVLHGAASVGKAAADLTASELSTVTNLMSPIGVHVGQAVLRGTTAFVGIAFVVVDTALLVRDWKNPPELVEKIQTLVQDLQAEIQKCENELKEISLYSNSIVFDENHFSQITNNPNPDSHENNNLNGTTDTNSISNTEPNGKSLLQLEDLLL